MIAVVFSGSRYADWRLAEKGRILHGFRTTGINPYIQDERFIFQLLNKNTQLINNAEKIRKIYFFGAGASSKERQEKIEKVFSNFFKNAKVKASHDMLASAISTFGNEKGIIGIIGSGSNAAYYNGRKVVENNYGLGYILADEASTNWQARQILKDFLTESMPQGFREKLLHKHNIDRKVILDKTYNSPNPNIFLTSFADFILENKDDPYMEGIIKKGLEKYVKTYLVPLSETFPDSTLNFTGSVANNYADWLREIAKENHLAVGTIIREPVQNLVKYFINKN
ncbi:MULTISPECIES: BadF/BadG/BcrA/BcrD ATPase family protein [unclassified Sphingobacterium]|uniref:BadF/BadG/BcrA/BcrD ATPase family protein n=1 Tax=unclassified Sphingobacterium TaxID=2609468 RepID=UPI0020C4AF58|nr:MULTISPECIES: BadF/BadG/BcrA/BcrD ATPase family protein [unclassified Sphingobacterium]